MHRVGFTALPLFVLGACATVTSETRTVAVIEDGFYAGECYEIRQRQLEGPQGPYEQTSVVYRGLAETCIIDSPNDCKSKAERLIEAYQERFF